MIFFIHPLFRSFNFSSDCGVAKANSPTVMDQWYLSAHILSVTTDHWSGGAGGWSVLRCLHFRRFRVTVANDYKAPGCVLFFALIRRGAIDANGFGFKADGL